MLLLHAKPKDAPTRLNADAPNFNTAGLPPREVASFHGKLIVITKFLTKKVIVISDFVCFWGV